MRKGLFFIVILAIAGRSMIAQPHGAVWKTFENRRGWSIRYPGNWHISSCEACADPTDPDVFAEFSSPSWGTVAVIPEEPRPLSASIDSWLSTLGKNRPGPEKYFKRIRNERFSLNGMPALHVRDRDPDGQEWDANYIVTACGTFNISFFGLPRKTEDQPDYPAFLRMLSSFRIKCQTPDSKRP